MKVLLDTHVFLWLVEGDPRLSRAAQLALRDPARELHLSTASVWELAIKVGNGRLQLQTPLASFVPHWAAVYQLRPLPLSWEHALTVAQLPNHHKDPFDRILVAQARVEGMSLITADANVAAYGVPCIW